MNNITDADYAHAKTVSKDFEIKNWGEYHDVYVQSDTLLLADVFENIGNMCLKIYPFDPAKCLSAPRFRWEAALKKTKEKLDILTDISMLLMVRKCIRWGICTLLIHMQKLITNTWKIMVKKTRISHSLYET